MSNNTLDNQTKKNIDDRDIFSANIVLTDTLKKDLAEVQKYFGMNNRVVTRKALELFVKEQKEMIKIHQGKTLI